MNDIVHIGDENLPEAYKEPEYCPYCGAKLYPQFYYCLNCATPFKHPDSVIVTPHVPVVPTDGELIQKKAPQVYPMFFVFMGVLMGTAIVCFMALGPKETALHYIISSAALCIVTFIYAAMYFQSLAVQFKTFGFNKIHAWIGLAALIPLLFINYGYHNWIESMHSDKVKGFDALNLDMTSMVILICVIPGIIEEIAFRGLIQHWLQTAIKARNAMMLAAALFTVLHFSLISAPYLFAVGMLLGWVKYKTKSLYPCILIHFLHNLAVVTLF